MDRAASIVNIRLATLDDIEALVSLRIQLLEADDASFDGALRAWLRTHPADGSFLAWIAQDAGTVVAASGLTVLDRPPYPGNATGLDGYVTNMYTLPAYRRRGLARQLLESSSRMRDRSGPTGCSWRPAARASRSTRSSASGRPAGWS